MINIQPTNNLSTIKPCEEKVHSQPSKRFRVLGFLNTYGERIVRVDGTRKNVEAIGCSMAQRFNDNSGVVYILSELKVANIIGK